jgi:hypothetical protein
VRRRFRMQGRPSPTRYQSSPDPITERLRAVPPLSVRAPLKQEVAHRGLSVVALAIGTRGDPERALEGAAERELGFVADEVRNLREPEVDDLQLPCSAGEAATGHELHLSRADVGNRIPPKIPDMSGAQNSDGTAKRVVGRPFPQGVSGNPSGRPRGLSRTTRELVGEDGMALVELWWSIASDPMQRTSDRLVASRLLANRGWG